MGLHTKGDLAFGHLPFAMLDVQIYLLTHSKSIFLLVFRAGEGKLT